MTKFLPISRFKRIDPKEFDLNNYTNKSLKECVLEVELHELHNDYPLATDKIEIKRKVLSEY